MTDSISARSSGPVRRNRMLDWEVTGDAGRRTRIRQTERAVPVPRPGDVLVEVEACGVCRTDLHVADGDLPVHRKRVVLERIRAAGARVLGPGV